MVACALLMLVPGCGTTKTRSATDQLLLSDAVDRTVSQIDFHLLSGQKVYFDTSYLKTVKGIGFVNADYVISSLRQQMVAAGLLLQEKKEDADYIVEARVGALGTDGHQVTYGIPPSTGLTEAASLLPNTPRLPSIPEISLARKEDYLGAAKIAVFAYHRETKEPIWQSGIAVATSTAKGAWILGAGPIEYGTIYDEPRLAGERIWPRWFRRRRERQAPEGVASYFEQVNFLERMPKHESPDNRVAAKATPQATQAPQRLPPAVDDAASPIGQPKRPAGPSAAAPTAEPAKPQPPNGQAVPKGPPKVPVAGAQKRPEPPAKPGGQQSIGPATSR